MKKEITVTLTEDVARLVLEALHAKIGECRLEQGNGDSNAISGLAETADKLNEALCSKQNTLFHYLYRDNGNYKTFNECVLAGEMTDEDYARIKESCLDGEYFIPSQVGLEEVRNFDYDPEMDHPWFELEGYEYTDKKPNLHMSIQELVEAFEKRKNKWEPENSDFCSC